MKLFLHKLTNWEYWPFEIVYIPIYFLWLYYAIRAKSFFFFNTSNPKITNGGFMAESKMEIYNLIPQKYFPKTYLIKENSNFTEIQNNFNSKNIQFPCIAKPDIGLRGSAVKKVNNFSELEEYNAKANFDFLVQDLIPYENEIGIFYVRFPNEEKGKITGIVSKEFLIVSGNGKDTILKLILANPRYALQLKSLKKEYGNKLNEVLPIGEKLNLVPYGNHARGAKFVDGSHLISDKLTQVIDAICQEISEFYFGRIDLMYNTIEDLENNKNYSIIEVNGAASEPTHIYDPKHSLFFAWKELARHIGYLYKISTINKKRGYKYLTYKEARTQFKIHFEQSNKIVNF